MSAYGTFLRGLLKPGVHVVLLAVDLAVDVVESLASEGPAAGTTHEARRVIQTVHGLARLPGSYHFLAASGAVTWYGKMIDFKRVPILSILTNHLFHLC